MSSDKTDGCYHLGHYLYNGLKKYSHAIGQIDAATGEQETNQSILERSIQLAKCFRKFGLQPGDVVAYGGKNHLDIHLPYYASLLNGLPVVGIDPFFKLAEIKELFKVTEPKMVFCQSETYDVIKEALYELELAAEVVTFDDGEHSMKTFLKKYYDANNEEFKPAEFDTDKIYAWLVSTSGSTGAPKIAAFRHQDLIKCFGFFQTFKNPRNIHKPTLNLSPPQWVSSFFIALCMISGQNIKLQSSMAGDIEHVIDMINKYKPVSTNVLSPSLVVAILKSEKHCDLSCFNLMTLGGSKTPPEVLTALREKVRPDAVVIEAYGQTECLGPVLMPTSKAPLGSCGKPIKMVEVKLVDKNTGEAITEPHKIGELWSKGLRFAEYYKNPEETAKAITPDGWFKTGDLLYRDEEDNYFFVDRTKMMMKCRGTHILPPELEDIIRTHSGVDDVAVTSVPHPDDGDRPVAVIVRKKGYDVTAAEIKDLIASKLHVNKQLSGGVVFVDELPMTSTGKVARSRVKELVLTADRE